MAERGSELYKAEHQTAWRQLFNTRNGDMYGRNGSTQAWCLRFRPDTACRFGNGEVYAAQADIGSAVNIAQGFAGESGQLVHVVCKRCAEVWWNSSLTCSLVYGLRASRYGSVFACHLDDKLAQVAFHRLNAFCFKIMVQLDFFADHGFAFDHQLAVLAVMMS